MIAFGIGTNSVASVEAVVAAVTLAAEACGSTAECLATLARDGREAAVRQAGEQLGIAVRILTAEELAARDGECLTRSPASLAATGLASVAEAAALAGAGPRSRLLLARRVAGPVTVAVARGETSP